MTSSPAATRSPPGATCVETSSGACTSRVCAVSVSILLELYECGFACLYVHQGQRDRSFPPQESVSYDKKCIKMDLCQVAVLLHFTYCGRHGNCGVDDDGSDLHIHQEIASIHLNSLLHRDVLKRTRVS